MSAIKIRTRWMPTPDLVLILIEIMMRVLNNKLFGFLIQCCDYPFEITRYARNKLSVSLKSNHTFLQNMKAGTH